MRASIVTVTGVRSAHRRVEDIAQDHIDVPAIAKRLAAWFPVS
ncbi:hypothetical protein ACWD1Z_28005 [Streptomyces sp. NPDC002784]